MGARSAGAEMGPMAWDAGWIAIEYNIYDEFYSTDASRDKIIQPHRTRPHLRLGRSPRPRQPRAPAAC